MSVVAYHDKYGAAAVDTRGEVLRAIDGVLAGEAPVSDLKSAIFAHGATLGEISQERFETDALAALDGGISGLNAFRRRLANGEA